MCSLHVGAAMESCVAPEPKNVAVEKVFFPPVFELRYTVKALSGIPRDPRGRLPPAVRVPDPWRTPRECEC